LMKDMVYGARIFIPQLKGKVVMNFRSKETLRNDHYYLGSRPTVDTALIPLFHTRLSEGNQVQTYMHARIKFRAYSWHKWITETISRKKKGDYQSITLYPRNGGTKLHKQSTGGCVRLELHNIFTRLQSSFLLLSNIVYSKGEHLSYSASVGKGWMQRFYSGLGYKHLAF
jgi:hypothetical protein